MKMKLFTGYSVQNSNAKKWYVNHKNKFRGRDNEGKKKRNQLKEPVKDIKQNEGEVPEGNLGKKSMAKITCLSEGLEKLKKGGK